MNFDVFMESEHIISISVFFEWYVRDQASQHGLRILQPVPGCPRGMTCTLLLSHITCEYNHDIDCRLHKYGNVRNAWDYISMGMYGKVWECKIPQAKYVGIHMLLGTDENLFLAIYTPVSWR